jgi:hypothetical protein
VSRGSPNGFSARQAKPGKTNDGVADDVPERVVLLAGVLAGTVMGIRQNVALGPRRPINLIGGGLSFLVPAAGTMPLAKLQGWLHIIGAIRFPAGVAIVPLKGIRSPPDGLAGNAAGTSPCHFLSSSVA